MNSIIFDFRAIYNWIRQKALPMQALSIMTFNEFLSVLF